MTNPVFSFSLGMDEFMRENPRLFQALLDSLPLGIQVLNAQTGEDGAIIDFRYSFFNELARPYTNMGKTFYGEHNNHVNFQQLVHVVQTGSNLQVQEQLVIGDDLHVFDTKYSKFGDGILVTREKIRAPGSEKDDSRLQEKLDHLAAKIANIGNWQWDTTSGEIIWAENTYRLLGYEPFSIQPGVEMFLESVYPEDRSKVIDTIKGIVDNPGNGRNVTEYRITRNDTGETRFIRSIGEPYHLDGKTIMIGTLMDITEEVGLLREINEKNRQLQQDLDMHRQMMAMLSNFKKIVEASNDPIISIDLDGKITYWSSAAESLFGYSQDEVIGKKLSDSIVPSFKKMELEKILVNVYEEGQSIRELYTQAKRNDGQLLEIALTIFPLKDEHGKITGSCAITRDRTEQTRNAEKIKEDALFIGQVADTTPDLIYILDLNTYQVIYANRQVAEDLHYTSQEIGVMKNSFLDLLHPDDRPRMLDHFKKIKGLESNKLLEIEYRLKRKKGDYQWYCDRNVVFRRDTHAVPVETIGISQNITERKMREEHVNTILDILNHAEHLSKMGSWEYDIISGNFNWSKGMYHLFNLPVGTVVSPDIYVEYAAKDEKSIADKIVNCIQHEFVPFEEILALTPTNGEKKILKIKGVLIKDKKKNPARMIGVDLDITDQVTAVARIEELNRELFIKNHDLQALNNELKILNNITSVDYTGTLQILYTNLEYIASKEARNLSDSAKANIRRAQSAIQKMKLPTSDLTAYLELYDNPVVWTSVDPNEILRNVLTAERRKIEQQNAGIEITRFPMLPSHPVLLAQLFSRLIDNGIKFRKLMVAPVIRITYSQADELNSIPGAIKNMPYGIISVSDNGIGFKEEEAEKIFDLFYKGGDPIKTRGSGIGLSICKKIMSLHGGFISAEGSPAHGATINCYFPLQQNLE